MVVTKIVTKNQEKANNSPSKCCAAINQNNYSTTEFQLNTSSPPYLNTAGRLPEELRKNRLACRMIEIETDTDKVEKVIDASKSYVKK